MKVSITAQGFDQELTRSANANAQIKKTAQDTVRVVSLNTNRRIKIAMPVDTGRARAGWGVYSPDMLTGKPTHSSSSDVIWRESENGLTIEQGTNIEYVEKLNEGSSLQAPAGFIDAAAAQAENELIQMMTDNLVRLLS